MDLCFCLCQALCLWWVPGFRPTLARHRLRQIKHASTVVARAALVRLLNEPSIASSVARLFEPRLRWQTGHTLSVPKLCVPRDGVHCGVWRRSRGSSVALVRQYQPDSAVESG